MAIPASVRAIAAYERRMGRHRDPADRLAAEVEAIMRGQHPAQTHPLRGRRAAETGEMLDRVAKYAITAGLDEALAHTIVADTIEAMKR